MTTATTIKVQPDNRASHKVAHGALSTMLMDDSLPPDVKQHVANARNALEAHATSPGSPDASDDNAIPISENMAASKRRAAGEDPEASDEDDETDDAPSSKMKGNKPNPLSGLKKWAMQTKDADDAPAPAKPQAKPTAPAKAKARFFGRGR